MTDTTKTTGATKWLKWIGIGLVLWFAYSFTKGCSKGVADAAANGASTTSTPTAPVETSALELFLDITPGMTSEGVVKKLGAPKERRVLPGGSSEYWIYGADMNQAVTFMDDKVMLAIPDIEVLNRQEARMLKTEELPARLAKLTPGMTPEMVRRDAGEPVEVRQEGGGAEHWIYGPTANISVDFFDGAVMLINWNIRELNRVQNEAMQQYGH